MIDTIATVVMTANDGAAGVSMHAGPTSGMLRRDALNSKCQLQGHSDNLITQTDICRALSTVNQHVL